MQRIFFISLMNGAGWGGSEELWYRTALYAATNGYKVGCALYDWDEKQERIKALREAGCRIYLIPNKGRLKRSWQEKIMYKWSKWQVGRFTRTIPFEQYEVTVVSLGGLEIFTPTWEDLYKRLPVYALLFHNYHEEETYKPVKADRLRRWILHAGVNLFAAKRIIEVMAQKLSITIPNPDVLLNPVTIEPPTRPTPYPAQQAPLLFVMLAELDVSRKAQDNLLRTLALPKWKERSWKLHLYGKGRDEAMLQQLLITLGLGEKVSLQGHTSEITAVLTQAHLVLQLTHRDAMPLAVVEAMAMARPLVVSCVGDMPSWVQDGINGWQAVNASIAEMDAALEKAWQERARWETAGKESFRIFQERFSFSPEKRLLQQVQQAIGKK